MSLIIKDTKTSLRTLPAEVTEKIVEYLDLASICNLRLSCQEIANSCYGPHFKSYFKQQRTTLTSGSLQKLHQITSNPKLAPAVRTVAVIAVVYDASELDRMLSTKRRRVHEQQGVFSVTTEPAATQEELDEAQRSRDRLKSEREEQQEMRSDESDVQLLADALRNLGALDVLTVEAAIDQGNADKLVASSAPRAWHPIWIRGSQVYRIVMLAIARSGVAINGLTFYNNSQRCSIPTWDINELMPALKSTSFIQATQHIKAITLSMSTKVETDAQTIAKAHTGMSEVERAYYDAGSGTNAGLLSNDDPVAVAEENYLGVARLLKHMPNLENLHLHLFNTLKDSAKSYAKMFSYIADEVVLASLRRLTLRCFYCDELTLLKFLRAHENIERLELREIRLLSGSWSPILKFLVTMPSLQYVAFQNLWKPEAGILNLGPKDPSKSEWKEDDHSSFPCMGGRKVHTRTFSQEDIQRERFQFADGPDGRQLGSPQHHRWITRRRAECGPP
ncbi:MAG: hypothetical protein Q9209_006438 [Squamulea sp. 1 TL-2023]